eukprot:3316477-Amphidinium_carterae.2
MEKATVLFLMLVGPLSARGIARVSEELWAVLSLNKDVQAKRHVPHRTLQEEGVYTRLECLQAS